jgi:hypothetical protein
VELCNEVFVAAGYAPRYAASPLDAPELALVHAAIEHILQVNNPAPAIVIDSNWDVIAANTSTGCCWRWQVLRRTGPGLNLLQHCSAPAAWAIIWPMRKKFAALPGNVRPGGGRQPGAGRALGQTADSGQPAETAAAPCC